MEEIEFSFKCSICGYKNMLEDNVIAHIKSKKHFLCKDAKIIMIENREKCIYCGHLVKPYGYYEDEHLSSCKMKQIKYKKAY